ncbi:MAG: SDR family NAD(P)-dependent oxidoreductase [Stellaceae bacterium]
MGTAPSRLGLSSPEGLNVNPFTGIYAASKHAIEAIAQTMSLELQEFGVEVATVNPGPFLTGFNDRGFETWKSWEDGRLGAAFRLLQARVPSGAVRSRAGVRPDDRVRSILSATLSRNRCLRRPR